MKKEIQPWAQEEEGHARAVARTVEVTFTVSMTLAEASEAIGELSRAPPKGGRGVLLIFRALYNAWKIGVESSDQKGRF